VGNKWALVIGISNFKDSSLNLKYAAKDAKDFAQFLVSDGHFAKDHVKLLVDKSATRQDIVNALGAAFLGSKVKKDDLLDDNMGAIKVHLTQEDLERIEKVFPAGATAGDRYHEQAMKAVNI
jgi:hypothetical protein